MMKIVALCLIGSQVCFFRKLSGGMGFCEIYRASGVLVPMGEVAQEIFFFGKCMEYGKC